MGVGKSRWEWMGARFSIIHWWKWAQIIWRERKWFGGKVPQKCPQWKLRTQLWRWAKSVKMHWYYQYCIDLVSTCKKINRNWQDLPFQMLPQPIYLIYCLIVDNSNTVRDDLRDDSLYSNFGGTWKLKNEFINIQNHILFWKMMRGLLQG